MRFAVLAAAALAMLVCAAPASSEPTLTPLGTFVNPSFITAPPGDHRRVMVVEQGGPVRLIRDGELVAEPYLDLTGDVAPEGLGSIAFAPDYARTGRVYALHAAPRPGDPAGAVTKLDEFRAHGPDRVDPASRRTLLAVDFPGSQTHDVSQIQFGPDGLLYMSVGDGNTTPERAQDPDDLAGKLLRLDVSDPEPAAEVVGLGLRSPWRFSFNRLTGELALSDVGEEQREELTVFDPRNTTGVNFGWPCWEGTYHRIPSCPLWGHLPPAFDYARDGVDRCAIIGGHVVRRADLPGFDGRYVFGDYCDGRVRTVSLGAGTPDEQSMGIEVPRFALSSFGEDACGHVYVAELRGGTVSRIDDGPFTPCAPTETEVEPGVPPEPDRAANELPAGDGSPPATVGAPPTGQSPGGGAAPDTTRPRLVVTGARLQEALRSGSLTVGARCGEPCTLGARGTFPKGVLRSAADLRAASAAGRPGRAVKLRLRLSERGRRALSRALRGRRRVGATVTVTARDGAGNATRAVRGIVVR